MERLSVLLDRFRRRRDAGLTRVWSGPTPDERANRLATTIAAQLGYAPSADGLRAIYRAEAAGLLAWLSRESVAYGSSDRPPARVVAEVLEALKDLGPDALFWTNGDWASRWSGRRSACWTSLSDATFDVGVIGCDAYNAFIFWIEEED